VVGRAACYDPYDVPPLSKQVLTGRAAPESTALPQASGLDAEWRLGTPAVGLDLAGKRVRLADGDELGFDRSADRDRNAGPTVAQPGGGRTVRGGHVAGQG